MMIRATSFCILVIAALLLPWWATLMGVLYYTRFYLGLELVFAMLLVDAYIGVLRSGPYLTIGTLLVVVGVAGVRSWLRTHTPSV